MSEFGAVKFIVDDGRTIRVTLPYPPALNNLYFTVQSKGRSFRVLSTAGKEFKTEAFALCKAVARTPIVGNVGIRFKAFRPRKIGDLDGLFKVVFDALKGAAYIDDKQIEKIEAERFDDPINPRVELEIYPLSLL